MFAQMRAAFMAAGADAATATSRAYAALFGMVQRQASMVSFVGDLPAARRPVPRAHSARADHEAPGAAGAAAADALTLAAEQGQGVGAGTWHGLAESPPTRYVCILITGRELRRFALSCAVWPVLRYAPLVASACAGARRRTASPVRRSPNGSPASAPKRSSAASARKSSTRRCANDRGAAADRHRARSHAGRNGAVARAYIARRLTPTVVRDRPGDVRAGTARLLDEVGARYGVSPRIIVGIWGLESNFGGFSGVRPTIAALATLAWDPRRSAFFRGELLDALEILNRGDIDVDAHARLVGRRDGPAAVHAVELSEVRRGLRRRRPARHLVVAARRLRVDCATT